MRHSSLRWREVLIAAAWLVLAAGAANADTYPSRPVQLIVPFVAGDVYDVVARVIAPHLERDLGQPVIVDNRPGGDGVEAVAKAPPDGHTLFFAATPHAIAQALRPTLPYDIERDFAPVSYVAYNDMVFFLNPKVPVNHFGAFVDLAQKNPGKFSYASPGAGSQSHIVMELLNRHGGIALRHLPYRNEELAAMAVISGAAELTLLPPNPLFGHIAAGTLRPMANAGYGEHPLLPTVRPVAVYGFAPIKAIQWMGILATAGTPKETVSRLSDTIHGILYSRDVTQSLAERGVARAGSRPEQFQTLISNQIKEWKENVREANIRVD
jgi:tripartite-type tricarboxylate transporter receptor subunit TctC